MIIDTTILRKKILHRSCNRGCKETDILLGDFIKLYIDTFSEQDLHDYAAILDMDDTYIYQWIIGILPIPAEFNTGIMRRIIEFNKSRYNNNHGIA